MNTSVSEWLHNAKSDNELAIFPDTGTDKRQNSKKTAWENHERRPHNSINRLTGTTGEGMFAPYTQSQIWYQDDSSFDIYLLLDEPRLSLSEARTLLDDIGAFGYGRDASIGLGKFEIADCAEWDTDISENANACLTLAPCAPQGLGLDSRNSYYNIVTRFGRHGDVGVHGPRGPFKAPVLLAETAAVFSPIQKGRDYIGQALGGSGQLSRTIPATVHQGYAPYIPVHLPPIKQEAAT